MVGSPDSPAEDYGLLIDVAPMPGEEKLRLEKELLGLYLSDHPLRRISAELAKLSDTQAVEVTSALQDTEVRVAGLVREVRRVVTRKGQIMAYAQLEDLTGSVDVVLFPRIFEQVRLLFEPDKVLVVQGRVDARAGSTRATGAAAALDRPGAGAGGRGGLDRGRDGVAVGRPGVPAEGTAPAGPRADPEQR